MGLIRKGFKIKDYEENQLDLFMLRAVVELLRKERGAGKPHGAQRLLFPVAFGQ